MNRGLVWAFYLDEASSLAGGIEDMGPPTGIEWWVGEWSISKSLVPAISGQIY